VELFESLFGAEIEVTRAGCAAVADRFDWEWAAKHLLTAPALADYERIAAPAWADYERIRDTALADYERIAAWAFCDAYNAPVQA